MVLARAKSHYSCGECRASHSSLRPCTGCYTEWYCDEACQNRHWRSHKSRCHRTPADGPASNPLRARRTATPPAGQLGTPGGRAPEAAPLCRKGSTHSRGSAASRKHSAKKRRSSVTSSKRSTPRGPPAAQRGAAPRSSPAAATLPAAAARGAGEGAMPAAPPASTQPPLRSSAAAAGAPAPAPAEPTSRHGWVPPANPAAQEATPPAAATSPEQAVPPAAAAAAAATCLLAITELQCSSTNPSPPPSPPEGINQIPDEAGGGGGGGGGGGVDPQQQPQQQQQQQPQPGEGEGPPSEGFGLPADCSATPAPSSPPYVEAREEMECTPELPPLRVGSPDDMPGGFAAPLPPDTWHAVWHPVHCRPLYVNCHGHCMWYRPIGAPVVDTCDTSLLPPSPDIPSLLGDEELHAGRHDLTPCSTLRSPPLSHRSQGELNRTYGGRSHQDCLPGSSSDISHHGGADPAGAGAEAGGGAAEAAGDGDTVESADPYPNPAGEGWATVLNLGAASGGDVVSEAADATPQGAVPESSAALPPHTPEGVVGSCSGRGVPAVQRSGSRSSVTSKTPHPFDDPIGGGGGGAAAGAVGAKGGSGSRSSSCSGMPASRPSTGDSENIALQLMMQVLCVTPPPESGFVGGESTRSVPEFSALCQLTDRSTHSRRGSGGGGIAEADARGGRVSGVAVAPVELAEPAIDAAALQRVEEKKALAAATSDGAPGAVGVGAADPAGGPDPWVGAETAEDPHAMHGGVPWGGDAVAKEGSEGAGLVVLRGGGAVGGVVDEQAAAAARAKFMSDVQDGAMRLVRPGNSLDLDQVKPDTHVLQVPKDMPVEQAPCRRSMFDDELGPQGNMRSKILIGLGVSMTLIAALVLLLLMVPL